MKLEKLEDKIIVWETGRKDNGIEYDSSEPKEKYNRWRLTFVEDFLREKGEEEEADKIKKHMGKTLKQKSIPQIIPTGNYKIDTFVGRLKETIQRYVDDYGLELDPDFQRAHVWTMEQRIKFVEFVLQGGKPNPILFNCEGWMRKSGGRFVIVDGKQRLTSLLMFLDGDFTVFKELDEDNVGYYAHELDYIGADIPIVINDLVGDEKVLEWYLQMNRANIAHTEDELKKVEEMLENLR